MKNALAKTAVLAALLAVVAGCSREEGKPQAASPEVSPAAPESYMKDKAFRAKLDGQVKKRGSLAAARNSIVAQMTEMIEAKKKELGTDDEAKLKAALEKDPAWNELHRRCEDANTAIAENRRETMAAVRERISKKEEGRGKKEEGRRKKEEVRSKKEDFSSHNLKEFKKIRYQLGERT